MSSALFVVEIQSWDWPLHVGVRPASTAPDGAAESDLICVESIQIAGLVLAPEEYRSKLMQISLMSLPREIILGAVRDAQVGRLHRNPIERKDLGFYVNLFLPADTLQNAIVCLNSKWRSLHFWVDEDTKPGAITDFGFSGETRAEPSI